MGTAGAPQFGKRFVLDLAHPFSGKRKFGPDIFQAHRLVHADPVKKADDFPLPFSEDT